MNEVHVEVLQYKKRLGEMMEIICAVQEVRGLLYENEDGHVSLRGQAEEESKRQVELMKLCE